MRNLKTLTLGLALAIAPGAAFATQTMNKAESNVQFTQAPQVTDVTSNSAKITWKTDSASSGKVQYRPTTGGSWKTASANASNGNKDFTANLTGLKSGQTYEYQLVTNTGYVRERGQFTAGNSNSASSSSGTDGNSAQTTAGTASTTASSGEKRPIYRALNPATGAHVYVTNTANLPPGTTQEGIAGYLMKTPAAGTSKLYALTASNGDYFYTASEPERENAIRKLGFQDHGVAGYIATTQLPGTVPMYRMLNTTNQQHFYTTNPAEHASVLAKGGFTDEGVVGYVWQTP
jgi:hypothetical protein